MPMIQLVLGAIVALALACALFGVVCTVGAWALGRLVRWAAAACYHGLRPRPACEEPPARRPEAFTPAERTA